jgi:hypothetical protein
VTARCSHCERPRGQGARTSATHRQKNATESAKRQARKVIGGACGMPKRATTKPVLQMSTNTAGIASSARA